MPNDEPADASADEIPRAAAHDVQDVGPPDAETTTPSGAGEYSLLEARWAGVFPPPSILNAYDPDIRAAILETTLAEQRHQHAMTERAMAHQERRVEIQRAASRRGTILGAGLSAFALTIGFYAVIANHATQGASIIGIAAVPLATAFITTALKRGNDRDDHEG